MYKRPALTAVAFLSTATLFAQDQDSFDKGLAKVHSMMERGAWKAAAKELKELLEANKEKDYVLARRHEIEEDIKRCDFYSNYDPPKPEDLISGDLKQYDERTGKIKLEYDQSNLKDFHENKDLLIHPITFDGPYSIEVRGKSYPRSGDGVAVFVDYNRERGYLVVFGRSPVTTGSSEIYIPSSIYGITPEGKEQLAYKKISPVKHNKRYSCKVQVGSARVIATYNNRGLLNGNRIQKNDYGGFAVVKMPFDELIVEGKAQTSWIQGMLDVHLQEHRANFEKTYDRKYHVPGWLIKGPKAKSKSRLEIEIPETLSAEDAEFVKDLAGLLEKGDPKEGLIRLSMKKGSFPKFTHSFLTALLLEAEGKFEEALPHCEAICREKPNFAPGRLVLAHVLSSLSRKDEAEKEFETLTTKHETFPDGFSEYAAFLLRKGDLTKAREVLAKAEANNAYSEDLEALGKMLFKAEKGPGWPQLYQYQSKNYLITSDISREICIEASRVLEQAYVAYKVQLSKKANLEKADPFRVFLFSGRNGYLAYSAGTTGNIPIHSAGLYSPLLKQLLIWNLPDREDMMRTIRHEGFHQFLDRITDVSPTWTNEGMAEYYERGELVNGGFRGGQIRKDHIRTLKEKELAPLGEFLYIRHPDFYKDAALHYSQAWALIHFFNHGPTQYRSFLSTFLDSLQEGTPKKEALDKAMEGIDLKELEMAFKQYVSGLEKNL